MTTDLVTTGPPMMELRWGQMAGAPANERAFRPRTAYQADRGYLHPGVLGAAVLGAARTTVGLPTPVRAVSVAMHRLAPLGGDLRAVVGEDGDARTVQIHHMGDTVSQDEPEELVASGEVHAGEPTPPPNLGELRSLADVPIPEPEGQELHDRCYVCGSGNPNGLNLLPGWHAPDTVVTGFTASEQMAESGGFSPAMTAALLACPTLRACRDDLATRDENGAVPSTYEVTYLADARPNQALRTIGMAGESSTDRVRGSSALVGDGGQVYAVGHATWRPVAEAPDRDPGRVPAGADFTLLTGGRPEERRPDGEGEPLPGRREAPGPRSERPDDHDSRRSQHFAHRSTGPTRD